MGQRNLINLMNLIGPNGIRAGIDFGCPVKNDIQSYCAYSCVCLLQSNTRNICRVLIRSVCTHKKLCAVMFSLYSSKWISYLMFRVCFRIWPCLNVDASPVTFIN